AASASYGQSRIDELLRYIEAQYVEEVDREELVDKAIESILEQLDPHSSYITAEQFQAINDPLEGNFDGIGVEFMILDDTIVIVNTVKGGPSEAVGIQTGDKIVMVEDSLVAGVNIGYDGIKDLLRGKKGTEVKIGIRRDDSPKLRYFDITRDEIPMHSIDAAYMINEKTGYVKLNRFSATTYEEFMKALEEMVDEDQMEDLVIDLRHNPGGYLPQAAKLLNQLFVNKNQVLVYTEGAHSKREEYETNGRAFFNLGDIAVLIDEGSASASEIVAGTIQDYDRGIIIGRRSFGKGLVQQQFRLRDGSAVRLTIAHYYTPSGRSVQRPYQNLSKYENDLMSRYESGELLSLDNLSLEDSTEYFTQQGRVVYGSGGIIPDIFVPADTTIFQDNFIMLRQQLPSFVFRKMGRQISKLLEEYPDISDFQNKYRLPGNLWPEFLKYAEEQDLPLDLSQLNVDVSKLNLLMKAEIAKLLFDEEAFYVIWNENDSVIKEALEVLKNPKPLTVLK
ncbi:MAG: S41 family peptidase, partial [Bacteroidota bacterium]